MEAYGTLCSALAAHAPAARDWASLFLDVGAAAPKWPCGCALGSDMWRQALTVVSAPLGALSSVTFLG